MPHDLTVCCFRPVGLWAWEDLDPRGTIGGGKETECEEHGSVDVQ